MSICCRNVAVAGGTAVFVFFIPIQQGTWKSATNPIQSWTMSLAHDLVRGLNNSPAKAGLLEGQAVGSLYKRDGKKPRGGEKTRERNNTQREGEERKPSYTDNCPRHCLHLCRHPCTKENTQNKLTAGRHHLLSFKSCWENKRKTQISEHRRKTKGSNRRESSSSLQASSISRSRYARFFIHLCIFISNWIVTRTLCEGNLITFTQCSCTREVTSRVLLVFLPSRITRLGQWPGRAGWAIWAELSPAQKYK